MMTSTSHAIEPTLTIRRDLAPFALTVAVGLVLSLLPYLAWSPSMGAPVWFADHDDLAVYSAAGAQAYDNHPFRLGDPPSVGGRAGMFPALLLVPGVLVAKVLGLGPGAVNFVWRGFAGLGLAVGFYAISRHYVKRPWLAAGFACLLLSNCGTYAGVPFLKHFTLVTQVATNRASTYLKSVPMLCYQWRIITPGLNFPFLALHLWLFARARDGADEQGRPTRGALALSAASFGLLFYTYFYYWTAAGLALLMTLALDRGSRRTAFHTGWIGGLIGAPSVIQNAILKRTTSPDWLERTDYFVPVERTYDLAFHPSLAILALMLVWVIMRRRDLTYLWSMAAAGGLLVNHQLLSKLEIENFHWMYVRGPCLTILLMVIVWDELRSRESWRRPLAWLLAIACLAQVGTCGWLRVVEATQSRATRSIMAEYALYRTQRLVDRPESARLEPGTTLGGDSSFVNLAAVFENVRPLDHYSVLFSPSIDHDEWDARIALNGYLLGHDAESFRVEQVELLRSKSQHTASRGGAFGPWLRSPTRFAERVAGRALSFETTKDHPRAALDRFHVRYVALPMGRPQPPEAKGVSWTLIQDGPTWAIYRLEAEN